MKSQIKFLMFALVSLFALMGVVSATPINVVDVSVEEVEGEHIVLVTLNNANISAGVYTELTFTLEELGTSKNVGVVKVDSSDNVVLQYNLNEVTDSFDMLKKGDVYQLTASTTNGADSTEAFLFGSEKVTDGLGLIIEKISVNSEEVTSLDTLQVLNGQELVVSLRFEAQEAFDNARIMAFVEGYEHSPIVESTEIFSVVAGKTYVKSFTLNLPSDMNNMQDYKLRITGANDLSGLTYKEFELYVDTQRNRVDILDLVMTPSSGVEAGQNIIANVRMKNRGQKDQDSVKVTVEIEELGVSESSYVTNLDNDEVVTSDDMLLFVPEDAAAKTYPVTVTLSYNDGYTQTTDVYSLNVLSPRTVEEENLLVSFKNNIDLMAGEANTFEVIVANPNEESKPISLGAVNDVWADVEVTPTLAMVKGGDSETFKVTVTPKSATAGEKELTLEIKEGSEIVSELTVSTYVEPSNAINWVNVALAILLIIAIIILLALVITIAKRRNEGNDDEDYSSTEEYY